MFHKVDEVKDSFAMCYVFSYERNVHGDLTEEGFESSMRSNGGLHGTFIEFISVQQVFNYKPMKIIATSDDTTCRYLNKSYDGQEPCRLREPVVLVETKGKHYRHKKNREANAGGQL
jgi:hypothetical protein